MDLRKLVLEQKLKAYKKIWECAWKLHLMSNPEELTDGLPESFGQVMDPYIRKTRCGYKYFFITVNPTEDCGVIYFHSKIKKCLKKCWIGNYIYCIEQRGGNDKPLGSGMHTHILVEVKKYKRPSDVKREIYNTFKNCVGNRLHVNVKGVMEKNNFVNYIRGMKKSEEKLSGVKYDNEWRRDLGLEDTYYNVEW